MTATKETIREWFDDGVKMGATHLLVVCDTFEHEDYPVFVRPGQDAREVGELNDKPSEMRRLMEVYHLGSDKEQQIASGQCRNYEMVEVATPAPVPKTVYEVCATGAETVRMFGCYRMPAAMRVWVYPVREDYQAVIETSGRVDLASAVQISQRCRDVSERLPRVSPLLSDYVLRPDGPAEFEAQSTSRYSVERTGLIRVPDYYHLKVLEGGEVVILTGGTADAVRVASLIEACRRLGFEEVSRGT